jgi:hypothetical protein
MQKPSAHDRGGFLVQHRFSMPKILCDAQKDCGKPGCLNDYRILVLRPWRRDDRTRAATSAFGTYRTCPAKLTMSVDRSKADLALGRIGAFTFALLVSPSVMRG